MRRRAGTLTAAPGAPAFAARRTRRPGAGAASTADYPHLPLALWICISVIASFMIS